MKENDKQLVRRLLSTATLLQYDPVLSITVVNQLLPYGKIAVLDVLSQLADSADIYNGASMMLLLRLLFAVPQNPGYFPRMIIGDVFPHNLPDHRRVPRYPMILHKDIPLVPIVGLIQVGAGIQPAKEHIDYYRSHCTLLQSPLKPPHKAITLLSEIKASPQWLFSPLEPGTARAGEKIVIEQLKQVQAHFG